MLHRCIHTPYHCRFLTERPIFHPRRFFFLPIGQSVSIFNAVPPSEPCTGLPAAWKRSGTTVHARPPTAHAPPIRLISIRVGTLGEASQFLPVFARVTIDRRPSLRDLVSHDLHGEINDPYVRENRLFLTGLNRAWLLLFFFYFWWSAVYPLCFAPIQSSWKGKGESVGTRRFGFWPFLFSLLVLTRMMNDSTIPVGILHGFLDKRRFSIWIWWNSFGGNHAYGPLGGFAIYQNVPLSIPQGRSACVHESWATIREVNRIKNVTNDDSSWFVSFHSFDR